MGKLNLDLLPDGKKLRDNWMYEWAISHPDWKDGESKIIHMTYAKAKRMASYTHWKVTYRGRAIVPTEKKGVPGSQRAEIYGSAPYRVKRFVALTDEEKAAYKGGK